MTTSIHQKMSNVLLGFREATLSHCSIRVSSEVCLLRCCPILLQLPKEFSVPCDGTRRLPCPCVVAIFVSDPLAFSATVKNQNVKTPLTPVPHHSDRSRLGNHDKQSR